MDRFKPYPFARALIVITISTAIVFALDALGGGPIDYIPNSTYAVGLLFGWWLFGQGVRR